MTPATVIPGWLDDSFAALTAGDVETYIDMYAPDAVHELPVTRAGRPLRLRGRDEIAAYMRQIPGRLRFGPLAVTRARVAGEELIIEAEGHHQRIENGTETPFDVRYVWFITIRDGKVTHFTDYTMPGQPAAGGGS